MQILMRRLLPWALLGLLTVGAAAGAALGVSAHTPTTTAATPAQWVSNVFATTAKAGTARFTYTHVTTSPTPDLRGTLSGSGAVDFTSGDVRVIEVDHQIEFEGGPIGPLRPHPSTTTQEDIDIGSVTYQSEFITSDRAAPFLRFSFHRDPHAELGLSMALNAESALGDLDGLDPVVAVRDLGPATVGGVATTKYLVSYGLPDLCPSARRTKPEVTELPSLVWVDGHGRLVQARSTDEDTGLPPPPKTSPFAEFPTGPSTSTDTLHFTDFGESVDIAAPPPSALAPVGSGGSSFGIALARCIS